MTARFSYQSENSNQENQSQEHNKPGNVPLCGQFCRKKQNHSDKRVEYASLHRAEMSQYFIIYPQSPAPWLFLLYEYSTNLQQIFKLYPNVSILPLSVQILTTVLNKKLADDKLETNTNM